MQKASTIDHLAQLVPHSATSEFKKHQVQRVLGWLTTEKQGYLAKIIIHHFRVDKLVAVYMYTSNCTQYSMFRESTGSLFNINIKTFLVTCRLTAQGEISI